jgi:hypothetical protein
MNATPEKQWHSPAYLDLRKSSTRSLNRNASVASSGSVSTPSGHWPDLRGDSKPADVREEICRINAAFSTRENAVIDQLGPRRSALWNGSTHPGYSWARALTSSNCLSSSWVSVSSTAARLSCSWSRRFAPMMTDVTAGFAKSHASERRAGLHSRAFAIGAITSRILQVRSSSTIGKS